MISLFSGCMKLSPSQVTLSQAQEKFIKICKEEYNLEVVLKPLQNTLWIYLPLKERILDFKASEEGAKDPNESSEKVSIRFVDGSVKGNQLAIQYDIAPVKTYNKDPGYNVVYTEDYQKKQQGILTTIQRSFFEAAENTEEKVPEFFVLVAADIEKGIELESIFYLEDLKRALAVVPSITQEEYSKRYVSELRGNKKIVGDTKGEHLNLEEMTLPEFLKRQIVNRISFRYQRSIFPPSSDAKAEITAIVAETLKAYNFSDVNALNLTDLNTQTTTPVEIWGHVPNSN